MAGLIDELIVTLNEMNELYEQLIESGNQKRKVIIENNVDALQQINENENILVGKTLKLDKKREELFFRYCFCIKQKFRRNNFSKTN